MYGGFFSVRCNKIYGHFFLSKEIQEKRNKTKTPFDKKRRVPEWEV